MENIKWSDDDTNSVLNQSIKRTIRCSPYIRISENKSFSNYRVVRFDNNAYNKVFINLNERSEESYIVLYDLDGKECKILLDSCTEINDKEGRCFKCGRSKCVCNGKWYENACWHHEVYNNSGKPSYAVSSWGVTKFGLGILGFGKRFLAFSDVDTIIINRSGEIILHKSGESIGVKIITKLGKSKCDNNVEVKCKNIEVKCKQCGVKIFRGDSTCWYCNTINPGM